MTKKKQPTEPEEQRMDTPTDLQLYAPITRIDQEKREVTLTVTAERLDGHKTIIGFDASKEAFGRWRGNIREMHQNKAVGKALEWIPLPETKEVDVTLRVSRGAEDTWQKVLDGTLSGGSLGASNGEWGKMMWEGKEVPFLKRYDLVEVSLVDNPSCPGCDVKIVRADGMVTEVLDDSPDEPADVTQTPEPTETRAGQRISHVTQDGLHSMRDNHLQSAKNVMQLCACDECAVGLSALDPDGDGDIDLMPTSSLDWDSDGGATDMNAPYRNVEALITRTLTPIVQRQQAMMARFATFANPTQNIPNPILDPEIMNRLNAVERSTIAELGIVRQLVSDVKGLAEKIAAQPIQSADGPYFHGVAPAEKRLAGQSSPTNRGAMTDEQVIQRAHEMGLLTNQQSQIAAAAQLMQAANGTRR